MHEGGVRCYRHSGKVPVGSIPIALISGVVCAALLCVPYGYAIRYVPLVFINIITVLVYGAAVGGATGVGAKLGRMRNEGAVLLMGLITGCTAAYAAWIGWIFAVSKHFVITPAEIRDVIKTAARVGTFRLFGKEPVKGDFLWFVWTVEALIIVGMSTFAAKFTISGEAFCERCQKWLSEIGTAFCSVPENTGKFVQSLHTGDATVLDTVEFFPPDAPPEGVPRLKLAAKRCDKCQSFCTMTISEETFVRNKEGKMEKKVAQEWENVLVPPEICERIVDKSGRGR